MAGIFCFFLSFYLLSAGGHPYSTDGELYYQVAVSLVERRSFAIDDKVAEAYAGRVGPDHRHYSKYAPAQSLAELPFYCLLRSFVPKMATDAEAARAALRIWVPTATNSVIGAATTALVYLAVVLLGYSSVVALLVSSIAGFATLLWPYSRQDLSEPLQSFLLLLAFLTARTVRTAPRRASLGTGLILGFLVLSKAIYVLLLPTFLLALLWQQKRTGAAALLRSTAAFSAPAALGLGIFLLYNHARYGSWLDFGYSGEGFTTPLLFGLRGWLLSPGKSIFLYTPTLLIALLASRSFARSHRLEAALVALTSFVLIGAYAQFWCWHGDWAWGPRFSMPLAPLWSLPIATAIDRWHAPGCVLIALLAGIGFFVQLLGVTVNYGHYLSLQLIQEETPGNPRPTHSQVHFEPSLSPLIGHWWLLRATVEDMRNPRQSPGENTTLRAMPWRTRIRWRPPHPEYCLGLDLWEFRDLSYLRRGTTRWTIAALTLSALAGVFCVAFSGTSRRE
jgi:hypothetical protein